MRLSFKHSNPVVFWAIAINTLVGTMVQGLHPAPRARILQVPLFRQNRPLWRLFRQQADIQRVKKSLSHGSDTECKPRDREMLDFDRYSGVNVLTSNTPIDPQCKSRKCRQIHAFTLGKSLHRASRPIVNRSTRVCVAETRYAHFIQHLPQLGMRAKCQTREADG